MGSNVTQKLIRSHLADGEMVAGREWGGCNHGARNIRLNTELVKKPKDLLEYVVVHEMLHLIAPTHSEQFLALMSKHYPTWSEARAELNELPLAVEVLEGIVGPARAPSLTRNF
jgi:predicted metal-dependent hydrolase